MFLPSGWYFGIQIIKYIILGVGGPKKSTFRGHDTLKIDILNLKGVGLNINSWSLQLYSGIALTSFCPYKRQCCFDSRSNNVFKCLSKQVYSDNRVKQGGFTQILQGPIRKFQNKIKMKQLDVVVSPLAFVPPTFYWNMQRCAQKWNSDGGWSKHQ